MNKNVKDALHAWWSALKGRTPTLSIEITKECPLRCPGCYAYEDQHLGGEKTLRQIQDFKKDDLVKRVLQLVDEHKPLHVSIVGGEPLMRRSELNEILPILDAKGIYVQLVTSAVGPVFMFNPPLKRLMIAVSIDGLQPEHDVRRKPATYERILKNIEGRKVTVHCTITGQMMRKEATYLEQFVRFWSAQESVKRIWMSMFTPQIGATDQEILSPEERLRATEELFRLRKLFPKLDMPESVIREFLNPPASPQECIFSRATKVISADLKTVVTPCQFGGNPDCSQCGCMASMALAAVGHAKILPGITAGGIFKTTQNLVHRITPAK